MRERRPHGDHLELRLIRDGSVQLRAGNGGVAPLYVAADDDRLIGSWDLTDLVGRIGGELSPVVVARLLTRRHRYSHDTVFPAITRLTAGTHAVWRPGSGLSLRYPDPAHHVLRPRTLRAGADPIAGFTALLDHALAGVVSGPEEIVAVEMSGGLDSANIAVSAIHHGALVAGGIDVYGRTGRAQRQRRSLISAHLRLPIETVSAVEHLPLDPDGSRVPSRPHQPDGDVYQEAFDALRARLSRAGARTVLTGYGGDEIMSRTSAERGVSTTPPPLPPWLTDRARAALADVDAGCSPVTAVALPTLLVFAARHPAYLRAGLWPIAPYTDPRVSRFARSLPVDRRTGKELLRQRLTRIGFPRAVTHPDQRESFADTMHLALRRHAVTLLSGMLDQSPLIEHDLVRRDKVEQLWCHVRQQRPLPPLVFDMLALDIAIRSMTATTTATPSIEEPCVPSPQRA
ncbi:asparagine synthase (glutamine-hydrolysing) [Pseudonocardia kunmingensis]|uniref:Asparagine synthase (Glutamine-hydrolysing) n=1 Tax=Pseudonocardia kunmingensis TaxID=630975 RepID=A0A543DLH1_9PSEU|nr:asparagine synthase (glutamine-hydrolysing) [Pseudonocardia kunmingensis]